MGGFRVLVLGALAASTVALRSPCTRQRNALGVERAPGTQLTDLTLYATFARRSSTRYTVARLTPNSSASSGIVFSSLA